MVKSARLLLVAALLAVVGACAPTNPEPAVTPMAALPDAPPPMMVPSIDPPSARYVAPRSQKRLSAVKKHTKQERKVVAKKEKAVKAAKLSKKKKKAHHSKVAKASARHAPVPTKVASRVKPAPASVPLDSPAPAMSTAPMAASPSPLSPGLR
jgi:hypothetical protein